MGFRRVSIMKLATVALVVVVTPVLTSCDALSSTQNTFNPSGDVAQTQLNLFIMVLIPAIIILIGVFLAIGYIMVRYRRREGDPIPPQIHGNNRLEIGWTIAPTILLLAIAVPTVAAIFDLGGDFEEDDLRVKVVAFQWDWRFEYLDPEYADEDGNPLATQDLYIPIDRYVGADLEALDVIHSFWIPKLAGKQDVMPSRDNTLRFNATEPGVFQGQCAEFCGISHSFMRFTTTALEPAQFDECLAAIAENGEDPVPEVCVP